MSEINEADPASPRSAESREQAVETLDAAGFDVHGAHAPAELWMLCRDQRCLRIRAALDTFRGLVALPDSSDPAGREEATEPCPTCMQPVPIPQRGDHDYGLPLAQRGEITITTDGSGPMFAATPAPDNGAEERLLDPMTHEDPPYARGWNDALAVTSGGAEERLRAALDELRVVHRTDPKPATMTEAESRCYRCWQGICEVPRLIALVDAALSGGSVDDEAPHPSEPQEP